ncbi:hypothetical protein BH23GEM9_BH23GEM9_27000 [soil metagenome]
MRSFAILATFSTALFLGACGTELPTADVDPPLFAHESNNQAQLSGMQNGTAITGVAIVNAIVTRGQVTGWRSAVNVQGDLAPGTYFFTVNLNGGNQTTVCSFTVDEERGGRQGCNADTNLPGFNRVEIRDSENSIIASGTFDRRGGNRFN